MRTARKLTLAALIAIVTLLVALAPTQADLVTLTTDKDTTVMNDSVSDNNYGASGWLQGYYELSTGKTRNVLIDFDLPNDLAGSTVNTATLKVQGRYVTVGTTVGVSRMTQSWLEGTGNNTASDDGATWNTYDGTTAWPGTNGTPVTNSVSDGDPNYTATVGTGYNTAGPIYDLDVTNIVAAWAGGATNNGLMIQVVNPSVENENFSLWASDDTGGTAPQLVIDYTIPEPMTMSLLGLGGLGVLLRRRR
jgi:hypothetical protein